MEWITRPAPEYDVPNIYWIIAVLTGTKKDEGDPNLSIKLWAHPVGALKDILKNRFNLIGS